MLQRKRQQYRKSIRRRQIQKIFADKRDLLLQDPQYIEHIYADLQKKQSKGVEQAIQNIMTKIEYQNYLSTQIEFTYLISQLQRNNTQTSFFLIKRYDIMVYLIRSVIKNQQKIEEKMQWKRMSKQMQSYFLQKLFKILSLLHYGLLRQQPYLYLISSFWLYYTERELMLDHQSSRNIFNLSLKILKQMLLGQHKIILEQLKGRGLGSQIIKITSNKLHELSTQNEKDLIQVIFKYIDLQIRFKQRDFENNINGITIIGLQSSQKTYLMAFALYILDIKLQSSQLYAVKTLIHIFQLHEYLIDSLKEQYITMICNLIESNDRKLSIKALQLLNDIVFHGKEEIYEHLLQKTDLLTLLKDQIIKEIKYHDDYNRDMINYVINILCNVTLINKKNRKDLLKMIIKHPIWQLCYENINMNMPFLELVAVFQYYFDIIGRSNIMKFFQPFLYAVSQLDFNLINKKQLDVIKRIILRTYMTALQHWQDGYSQKMKQLCTINRLTFILQEMMECEQYGIDFNPL